MKKFNIQSLATHQKELRRRILEISFKNNLSHIGSCMSAVDIIDAIYMKKKKNDIFVLSNGHAGVGLYSVLEKYGYIKKKQITEKLHIHPDRNPSLGISVSSGSLGQGLPIAVGMALADKKKTVYCMISDGECTEGSIWESLSVITSYNIQNLILFINANGWGAYSKISIRTLMKKMKGFVATVLQINGHSQKEIYSVIAKKVKGCKVIFAQTDSNQLPFLRDLDAHYYHMTEKDYQSAIELLS